MLTKLFTLKISLCIDEDGNWVVIPGDTVEYKKSPVYATGNNLYETVQRCVEKLGDLKVLMGKEKE